MTGSTSTIPPTSNWPNLNYNGYTYDYIAFR